ncbi:MAG TPA: restriction endonuclease [Candidatus Acidoferrales bacterium]|nr:restriction endonuclease [Candidatus Acidoferrales bacterium]
MGIPDYQSIMLPLLKFASDGKEHSLEEARERMASVFTLTDEDRKALLPSGRQTVFSSRVAWAKVYLHHAGLLTSPRRGYFQISDRGREVLRANPREINVKYLERFPEFVEFRTTDKKPKKAMTQPQIEGEEQTPEEMLESAYQRLRADLAAELLVRLKNCSPQFFERLVVEVLLKMGYGGSRKEAGEAIGATGDEGIDGIINEDRLGLDVIYLQAKRWQGTVGRPEIQKFVGALQGKRAKKGIFITTGMFSTEALDFTSQIESKVALIDGKQLAELMIDSNVGVTAEAAFESKRIDSDYFEEE